MKIKLSILIGLALFTIWQSGVIKSIPGTDADGSNNYAVSIGNDDCFATFQTGDYFGASAICGSIDVSAFLVSNLPKPQELILPSFRRGDGIF
jgi:hypothetical protein